MPFSSPGDLPDPGIEPLPPVWQADSLPLRHLGSPPRTSLGTHGEKKRNVMRVITHVPEHSVGKKCIKAAINVLGLLKGLKSARGSGCQWVAAVELS